jgi:hypothetical protein
MAFTVVLTVSILTRREWVGQKYTSGDNESDRVEAMRKRVRILYASGEGVRIHPMLTNERNPNGIPSNSNAADQIMMTASRGVRNMGEREEL